MDLELVLLDGVRRKIEASGQKAVCDALGMSQGALSGVVNGKWHPSDRMARRIMQAYPDLAPTASSYLLWREEQTA